MEEKTVLSKLLRRVRLHKVTREDEVKPVIEIITRLCAQILDNFMCCTRFSSSFHFISTGLTDPSLPGWRGGERKWRIRRRFLMRERASLCSDKGASSCGTSIIELRLSFCLWRSSDLGCCCCCMFFFFLLLALLSYYQIYARYRKTYKSIDASDIRYCAKFQLCVTSIFVKTCQKNNFAFFAISHFLPF